MSPLSDTHVSDTDADRETNPLPQSDQPGLSELEETPETRKRLAFLAEAGATLLASLDYHDTLDNLARLSVTYLADWCVVDAVEEGGQLTRAVACADLSKLPLARALKSRLLPDPGTVDGVLRVLLSGESEINPDLPEDWLGEPADTEESLALVRGLGLVSNMLVPLRGRGRTLGVITFAMAESGRRYGPEDLALAQELARRASLALDNARMYQEAQRDLARRKDAETAKRQSDSSFRLLFAANPHPMWVYDLETLRVLEVNSAAVSHYGYSRAEFLKLRISDLRPKEDLPAFRSAKSRLDQSGWWRHRTKDGRLIDVEIASHRLTFNERKAALVVAEDITERLRAEVALRQSEARLRRLIESNIIGVIFSRFKGGVVELNDAFLDMIGYDREELVTDEAAWRELTPPEFRPLDQKAIDEMLANGVCTPYEKELVGKNGERVAVLIGSALLSASDESPYNAVSYAVNITDRKRAEDEVKAVEARQRAFVRDVLVSVTAGKLHLCDSPEELPETLKAFGAPIPLRSETLAELRARVREAAEVVSLPEMRLFDLISAIGEASMNAVVHGGGVGAARVSINEAGTIQVRVEDKGSGISVHTLPRATLEKGFSSAGTLGHGFWMMLQTVDRLWLLTGATGTTVVIEQDREVSSELDWMGFG